MFVDGFDLPPRTTPMDPSDVHVNKEYHFLKNRQGMGRLCALSVGSFPATLEAATGEKRRPAVMRVVEQFGGWRWPCDWAMVGKSTFLLLLIIFDDPPVGSDLG